MFESAPQLLASAMGVAPDTGDDRCFYCGASCDQSRPLKRQKRRYKKGEEKPPEYLKPTFTDWASVAVPESDYCCSGCVLALNEFAEINGKSRQKMRNYSWVITETEAEPLTKADIAKLRSVCLDPPRPPFAIVIAATGQKHTLFRSPVNQGEGAVTVQFETDRITYDVPQLRERILLACQLVPATGKMNLAGPIKISNAIKLADQRDDWESLVDQWNHVYGEPLSRLAVFLTPKDGVM